MSAPMTPTPDTARSFEDRLLATLLVVDGQRRAARDKPAIATARKVSLGTRRRVVLIGVGTAGAASLATVAVAAGGLLDGPGLAAEGSQGYLGVKVAGCTSAAPVTILIDGREVVTGLASKEGYYQYNGPAKLTAGSHEIQARCASAKPWTLATKIDVTPRPSPAEIPAFIDVNGGTAARGFPVEVKAGGCASTTKVTLRLDGKVSATGVTDVSGGFDSRIPIPATTSLGRHRVSMTCAGAKGGVTSLTAAVRVVRPLPAPKDPKPPLETEAAG